MISAPATRGEYMAEQQITPGTKLQVAFDVPMGQKTDFNMLATYKENLDDAYFLMSAPMLAGKPLLMDENQKLLLQYKVGEETFGYQEAWADYRMKPNRVSGLMRSNATGTLDFWHYADNYSTVPTLSQGWMEEGKNEIARTLVVQNEPQFFGAIRVANKTTRRMPLYSVPGLYKL